MKVKGILVECRDGQEYLLGFKREPNGQRSGPPMLSHRGLEGRFELFKDLLEASKITMAPSISGAPT